MRRPAAAANAGFPRRLRLNPAAIGHRLCLLTLSLLPTIATAADLSKYELQNLARAGGCRRCLVLHTRPR